MKKFNQEEAGTKDEKEADMNTVLLVPVFRNNRLRFPYSETLRLSGDGNAKLVPPFSLLMTGFFRIKMKFEILWQFAADSGQSKKAADSLYLSKLVIINDLCIL